MVAESWRYDRLSCHSCKHYQYLSILKCANCGKKYCFEHAGRCCGKEFLLLARELDSKRRKLGELLPKTA